MGQPEIAHLGRPADDKDVQRFDVAVDNRAGAGGQGMDGAVQEVDGPGRVPEICHQFVGRDAGKSFGAAFLQAFGQALLAQAHGDDQLGGPGGGLWGGGDRVGHPVPGDFLRGQ